MKNIIIITQCSLPIPTTKGGAVETLVESIINQNEYTKDFNITLVTACDDQSVIKSKKYNNTKFIMFKNNFIVELFDKVYELLFFLITRKKHDNPKQYFKKLLLIHKIKIILKRNCYDNIIFENSGFLLKTLDSKINLHLSRLFILILFGISL